MRRLRPLIAGIVGAIVTAVLLGRGSELHPYLVVVAVLLGVAVAFLVHFAFGTGDRLKDLFRR